MTVKTKISGVSIASGVALSAVALLTCSAANAAPIVNFDVNVAGGSPYGGASWSQTGIPQVTPGLFSVTHTQGDSPAPLGLSNLGEWTILWNITADDNPSGGGMATGAQITSGFTVYNNLPDTGVIGQNNLAFSIMVEMQVLPAANTQFFGGGGFTLTVPDSQAAGPVNQILAAGGPIYNFMIDGADVASLYPNGFFLGQSGPGTNSTSQNLSPAQTGPLAGISPVTIGIRLDFVLTPGEVLTFNGVFAFIPAPGCLAMLALAGLTGGRRRE